MDFLSHPLVIAVLASLAPAIKGDIDAFRTFKSFEEAASYSWGTFAWRVFQGALLGVGGYFATFGAVAGIQSLVK